MELLQQVTVVYQLALVIVCLVLAVFTFLLPRPENKRKRSSSIYFRFFLVFICLAFYAFSLRIEGHIILSVIANNLLLLASAYSLMMTIYHRYELNISKWVHAIAVAHGIILVSCQLYFLGNVERAFVRDVFLYFNLSLPAIATLWQLHRQFRIHKMREKIIIVNVFLLLLVFSFAMFLYSNVSAEQEHLVFTIYFLSTLAIASLAFFDFALSITFTLVSKLREQIVTDPLTGAKNRNYFYDVSEKALANVTRHDAVASLILCDIDHFKKINDTYGHLAGDQVLKDFTLLMQDELRVEDSFIRVGGEEFIVLCPDIGLEGAQQLAERLRQKIEENTIQFENQMISVTASFGTTNLNPKLSIEKNVNNADKALYQSKELGRNQVNTFQS